MSTSPPSASRTCGNTARKLAATRGVGAQVHMIPPGLSLRDAAVKNSTEYRLPLPAVSGHVASVSMRS